jgi:putative ABC transport system permease protein
MLFLSKKVSIARSMIFSNKKRLAISLGAIAFTVLIMFMEMGFFNGINDSQSYLATLFNGDLVMMDHDSVHLNKYNKMDIIHLHQTLAFEEVDEVIPIYKGNVGMKNMETELSKIIFVLAFPPDSAPFKFPNFHLVKDVLKKQGRILFDKKSRKIYGKLEVGQDVEIKKTLYHIGGFIELGPNFSNDGTILMSDASWLKGRWHRGKDLIAYGLIRARPGTDIDALKKKIVSQITKDIIVLTPEELRRREVRYTIKAVPLGAVFGIGMIVGFTIGVIICYQILYNEIVDHMPQYATLQAMGFSDHFLKRTVVVEAVWLSILGFIPGLFGTFFIYCLIEFYTGIHMFLTPGRIVLILAITITMCVFAGLIAVKRVITADPAELY